MNTFISIFSVWQNPLRNLLINSLISMTSGFVRLRRFNCSTSCTILFRRWVLSQQLKQIFEPFFTTATSGTGLGLYIAREMCETNHASLEYVEGSTSGHFRIIAKSSNHADR